MAKRLGVWKDAPKSAVVNSFIFKKTKTGLILNASRFIEDVNASFNTSYTINQKGEILVDNAFVLPPYYPVPELPRIGMQTAISTGLHNVDWYGRGPHENYADRKTSARVGIYTSTVDELKYDYIRPQENGYRTDVRSVSFTNKDGIGFEVRSSIPICFNAQYYSKAQYSNEPEVVYSHPTDLKQEDRIYLNIDHKQMGVGGDNSWGAEVHEEYRVMPHEYYYRFVIRPIAKE